MSTEYEAHLVVGVLVSDLREKGIENLEDYIYGLNEYHGFEWYQEEDIVGKKVHSCTGMPLSTPLQRTMLGEKITKAIHEIEKELGCQAVLHTCVYTY